MNTIIPSLRLLWSCVSKEVMFLYNLSVIFVKCEHQSFQLFDCWPFLGETFFLLVFITPKKCKTSTGYLFKDNEGNKWDDYYNQSFLCFREMKRTHWVCALYQVWVTGYLTFFASLVFTEILWYDFFLTVKTKLINIEKTQ